MIIDLTGVFDLDIVLTGVFDGFVSTIYRLDFSDADMSMYLALF